MKSQYELANLDYRWLFYDLSLKQGSVSHKEITAYKKSMQYITVSKL